MTEIRVKTVKIDNRIRFDVVDNHRSDHTKFDVIYSTTSKSNLDNYLRIKGLDNLIKG